MKKIITLFIFVLCLLCLFGCGQQNSKTESEAIETADPRPAIPENIGEVFKLKTQGYEFNDEYIKVITEDMVYEADMTVEIYEKMEAVDFFSDDKEEQYAEILSALPVKKMTPKSELVFKEEQIKELVGKKGQAVLDLEAIPFGHLFEEGRCYFYVQKGYTNYIVEVEEQYSQSDDVNDMQLLSESTVKSIELWQ